MPPCIRCAVARHPSYNDFVSNLPTCCQCGYDLRGHAVVGRCPECGDAYEDVAPEPMWTPGRIAAVVYLGLGVMVLLTANVLLAGPWSWSPALLPHRTAEQFCVLWVVAAAVSMVAMIVCLFMRPPRGMIVLAFALSTVFSIVAASLNFVLLMMILMSI